MNNDDYKEKMGKYDSATIPYMEDPEYKRLYLKYFSGGYENFVLSEAIRIFSNTNDDNVKVRILELLRNLQYFY